MGTPLRLTVCGAGGAGLAIAADSALKGIDVTLFELPTSRRSSPSRERAEGSRSRRTRRRPPARPASPLLPAAPTDAAEAVAGADVVMITVPAMYHDAFMDAVAPHLRDRPDRALQHRLLGVAAPDRAARRRSRRRHAGRVQHHAVHLPAARRRHPHRPLQAALLRRRVPRRAQRRQSYDVLRHIYAQYDPAATVLDTNIAAAGNPPIHVTAHHPHRRPLLRPLHGRQVLPGHDHPRRTPGHGVRRRA